MRPARRYATLLALLALVAAAPPPALHAQSSGAGDSSTSAHPRQPGPPTACRRCLNGHRFLVSPLVPDPFITTSLRNSTGAGLAADLTVAVRNLRGQVLDSVGGDVGLFVLDFEYAYAATEWLALRAIGSAAARIGTDSRSVLASGASAVYGIALGATGRVWGNDAVQISLTADARRNQAWVVDPYRYAQSLTDGDTGVVAERLLLRDATANRYTGGVRAAWAPLAWLGLNAFFEAGAGEDPRPDDGTETVTEYGVLAGVDAGPLWRFPLGLTLGYRGQSGPGRFSDFAGTANSYTIGLLYTGREAYLVGVDGLWSRVNIGAPGVSDLDLAQVRLLTRFDF